MKTFEEIFDSIIEEKEEKKRRDEEELERRKKKNELNNKIITAYQFIDNFRRDLKDKRKANEFIADEKLMDLIFEDFRKQVENDFRELKFRTFIDPIIPFNAMQDVLLARLHAELPSYDITILKGNLAYTNKSPNYNYLYELKITAEKNPLKDKTTKPVEGKKEIPYVHISKFDDETRDFVAQRIYELLETIPHLDKEELPLFKEIGVVKEYQPMQVFNNPPKPEIISVRLFSNINDKVLERVKNLFITNEGNQYNREFSYSLDDDCNCVINMLKSFNEWGLKEI